MTAQSKKRSLCLCLLAFGALLCIAPRLHAESDEEMDEREAKEQEEELNAVGQNFVPEVTIKGKIISLTPLNEDGSIPKVVGTIIGYLVEANKKTNEQRTFLIKLTDPKLLRPRLAAMGINKEVQLRGRLFNKGKYLLVSDIDKIQIVPQKQPPPEGL